MAYEVAERNFIEGGVNRIVMASDGDLNVGMTSESDLYDFVDGKRETGVYLSVLGFGTGNYKDTKMEVLADHGNGSYHYIDSIEEANRVLSERLMANLVPFADDVKVQVEFNPAQVKGYRLIGYENRELAAEDFLDDTVDAGDVGPNAQFTVAYEIVPADSAYEVKVPELKYGQGASGTGEGASADYANASSSDWLTCSLRYHAFSDDAVHEQQLVVSGKDSKANPTDDWKFASAVIEFGMLASNSDYCGDLTCDSVLELLDGQHLNAERQSFRDLVELAKRNGTESSRGNRWIVEE
jgi:Ca-activated chloride channel family protein